MTQLLAAFFIGGTIVAGLGYLAEHSPRSLRGIVISFPSTMAVSYIFLALSLGEEQLMPVLPGVYYSLGGAILFAITFAYVAQWFATKTPEKLWPVLVTLTIAGIVWFAVALLITKLPNKISVALPTILFAIAILQPLVSRYANSFPVCSSPPETNTRELCFRALFSGSVIALALLVGNTFGPFWGAILGGTFPASFGSHLMIFQAKYPAKYLPSLIKTVPLGVLSTTTYATVVSLSYPRLGIAQGTLLALLASLIVSTASSKLTKEKNA